MTILKTILKEMEANSTSWDDVADQTLQEMGAMFRKVAQLRFHDDVKYNKNVNRELMQATTLIEDSMDSLKQAIMKNR